MSGDEKTTPGHGGRRVGAGRKPAAYEAESKDSYLEYKAAQAKREAARAELAEIELAQKRGDLMPMAEVQASADQAARIVRDAFLALPDRVAALLIGQDERQMAAILRAEVRAALQRISEAVAGES
jgi:hypothetical protein